MTASPVTSTWQSSPIKDLQQRLKNNSLECSFPLDLSQELLLFDFVVKLLHKPTKLVKSDTRNNSN
ncbi:4770_t:CDS:1, partial [Acaulospora colombiana]